MCGDRVSIDVALEAGRIRALAHRVKGCLLCEAVASIIGARAVGARVEELHAIRTNVDRLLLDEPVVGAQWWPELEMFSPVRDYRSRHDCVRLPFEALAKSLVPPGGGSRQER